MICLESAGHEPGKIHRRKRVNNKMDAHREVLGGQIFALVHGIYLSP